MDNLSDKVSDDDDRVDAILEVKDVKEFVETLNRRILSVPLFNAMGMPISIEVTEMISKLAGPKLT